MVTTYLHKPEKDRTEKQHCLTIWSILDAEVAGDVVIIWVDPIYTSTVYP